MKKFLLLMMSAMLVLSSCSNNSTKKAQEAAQKAETEYRQTVVDNINASIEAANKLVREFNAIKPAAMVEYEEITPIDMLEFKGMDSELFNAQTDLWKIRVESTISDVHTSIQQVKALKKLGM